MPATLRVKRVFYARIVFAALTNIFRQSLAITTAQPLRLADRLLLRLLQGYGALAMVSLALTPARFLPSEDAVILFAYSRNLAQHGAITFMAGSPHVEGATDFGWMVLIAAVMRCGIDPAWFCAFANVACLSGLAAVLCRLARRPFSLCGVLAVAGGAALFRQIFAAALGFAVLPDALLLAMLVLCVLRQRRWAAAIAALVLCLFRPDSVVLAVPLLCLLLRPKAGRFRVALALSGGFVLPGLLYFALRWHYFGELFPLPFLVKADFHRELGIFVAGSVRASLTTLLFTAIVTAPVLIGRWRQNVGLALGLIGVPTLFYWTMRLDQNVGSRFFYYLPAATAILTAVNWDRLSGQRRLVTFRTALAAWAVLLAAPLYRESLTFRYMQFDNVKSVATALGALPKHGTILTSEAGFLPYYSGWPTVDTWGLNTPEFAHRFFQPSDVARQNADLIVLHPDLEESCLPQAGWQAAYQDRSWPHMTRNLVTGASASARAREDGYELWLTSYGSEFYRQRKRWAYGGGDRECWLIRRNSLLRGAIEQILLEHHGVAPGEATMLEERRNSESR